MANPELGSKRVCQGCETRFYDLKRDPIICPSCGATFDPEAVLRSRRNRTSAAAPKEPVAAAKVEVADAEDVVANEDDDSNDVEAVVVNDGADDDEVIEDTNDRGEN